jgi:transposase
MVEEGILGIVHTGFPWRGLPKAFGACNGVPRRFGRWSDKGAWRRVFKAMSDAPVSAYLIVASTFIRARHAARRQPKLFRNCFG